MIREGVRMRALMVYGHVVPNWTRTINTFDKCLPLQPAYSSISPPWMKCISQSSSISCSVGVESKHCLCIVYGSVTQQHKPTHTGLYRE